MRAVVIESFGPASAAAKVQTVAAPFLSAGEVLIEVHAAGLNFADLLVIEGKYQSLPELPFVPGKEFAGLVVAVGENVTRVSPGDRVLAFADAGALAEQALTAARDCHVMPTECAFVDAVSLGINFQTAHFALVERANCRVGESVLVTGASGVVGLACVQLAKIMGATVIAGISNPERRADVESAGADHIIYLAGDDLRNAVRDQIHAATGEDGVDIVLDMIGGDVFDACLRSLAWQGRIVVVGFTGGRIPTIASNYLLVKNISAVGMYWDSYRRRRADEVDRVQQQIFAHWTGGRIRALPRRCFPLEAFCDAAAAITGRKSQGRVVILPR